VLTQGLKRDVTGEDELVISLVVREGGQGELAGE
jgi:hypothetical protein